MKDLVPLLVSALLGTAIGLERQWKNKPAGLRTHVLVCLGATLFVLLSNHAIADAVAVGGTRLSPDPTRIIHGVITGIGFLCAGTILHNRGLIIGLTTAASIWMVAAIGVTVGVHAYALAALATALCLVVLVGFRWLETIIGSDEDADPHR